MTLVGGRIVFERGAVMGGPTGAELTFAARD
jgi:hypothetical protein